MKIVIEIPEEFYDEVRKDPSVLAPPFLSCEKVGEIIANGKPLPKGHGRLIDADKCLKLAWQNLYKHEDEMEKKIEDYLPIKRFHEQRGFEVCQQTLVNAPTIIEAEEG